MAKLTIFVTENASSSLRGEISRWMLELKSGVFIGTLSKLVREKLWVKISNRIGKGGAAFIQAKNNEQKFDISTTGNFERSVISFDGLQLIRIPTKNYTFKLIQKKSIDADLSFVSDCSSLPPDFIIRSIEITKTDDEIHYDLKGNSQSSLYPNEVIWSESWLGDIKSMSKIILDYLISVPQISIDYMNKKIISLNIETTDYLQKAQEGYVNILGITVLDLREVQQKNVKLFIYQSINLSRKRKLSPYLVKLSWDLFQDVDVLIVFNKDFVIPVIQQLIDELNPSYVLPINILDYQDRFNSLEELEKLLFDFTGIRRVHTQKNLFKRYYAQFKGHSKGADKEIDPLGICNITNTLTPLLIYILGIK